MRQDGYFHRVHRLTETRLWINNPTLAECDRSIDAGAIACTTNPTFVNKQLSREDRETATAAIARAVDQASSLDEACDEVQRAVVAPIVERFRPLWDAAPGNHGFVSLQGNPRHDTDPDYMAQECIRARELGPNLIAKIPVTPAGLEAIKHLVAENVPVIATEVMSISQAIATCEAYEEAARGSGNRPPLYVTHITGIFDQHLKAVVERENIDIEFDLLFQAGASVARKQYALMQERGYPGIFLGGGARELHHFTELVGGEIHITVNWSGFAETLVQTDPPVVHRSHIPAPEQVVEQLLQIPDFKRSWLEDGLSPEEFEPYGPVQLFRNAFVAGWQSMEQAVADAGGSW